MKSNININSEISENNVETNNVETNNVETKKVSEEEQELLDKVIKHLKHSRTKQYSFNNYEEELLSLRDEIAVAKPEDIPPLVEHMARLQALAAQRGKGEEIPVDAMSPYFGHMNLKEDGKQRDVLLGKRTYLAPEQGIRIVDWRNAPVSRMYYCYDAGDDYEEIFGGRVRNGIVIARRSVTITEGILKRIACDDGTFVFRKGKWQRLKGQGPRLSGGQGVALRADAIRGKLGVDADGTERKDKHLPEISALLDKEQFQIITNHDKDLVVIQGSAGSGKTTVGLHRIAYLAFPKRGHIRYRPSRMIVVVVNEALATYISGVLPALGVNGVRVVTFEKMASELRRRQIRGLPNKYSEWTPSVVSRMKKHPSLLRILDDIVDEQDEKLSKKLFESVSGSIDGERIKQAWQVLHRMPIDARRKRLMRFIDGEVRIGRDQGKRLDIKTAIATESALNHMAEITSDVITDWADLFTDKKKLKKMFGVYAPTEFSEGDFSQVHEWCVKQYKKLDTDDDEEPPVIDQEDDAILLKLHQLKKGWLRGHGGRLEYDHLMVDEVQDFSALEVSVMMSTVGRGRPVTLAGDTAQRIVREGGFDDWDTFLDDLGVHGARVEPLKIAYRSTIEVMKVAREVLGPFAGDESIATRHGAEVEVHQFSDPGQAVDFLGTALRELSMREPLASIAVLARHQAQARLYYKGLKKAEVPKLEFITNQDFSFTAGVDVSDVRQVKGLEFDYVVMVECNSDSYPDNEEARHLMHVGITRAAHQLWILTTVKPSPLIPKRLLFE